MHRRSTAISEGLQRHLSCFFCVFGQWWGCGGETDFFFFSNFTFNFQIVQVDFEFAYQSPLVLLLLLLSLTWCFQVVAGTVWYNDSSDWGSARLPAGISVTAQMWVEETCNFLITCAWNKPNAILWKWKYKLVEMKAIRASHHGHGPAF